MEKIVKIRRIMLLVIVLSFFAAAGMANTNEPLMVDINKATAQELQTLSGIGKKYAERIVEYRETNGKFQKKEDIMKVKGIGKKKYEKIKDMITAGEKE